MSKEKTVREWLGTLPEDIREKVFAHAMKYHNIGVPEWSFDMWLDTVQESFLDAVSGSFVFDETDEGLAYWWDIINQYGDTDE